MPDYSKIKLIILDVDGTLTDGGLYYDSQGNEIKRFDVKDGLGIKVAVSVGLKIAILTGRESTIVRRRAEELGIHYLKTGIQKKYPEMLSLMKELHLSSEDVCYIGDDWNDLQCMNAAGICMCPADACEDIKKVSDYISSFNAGYGAVRDCLCKLLKDCGKWEKGCKNLYYSLV